MMGGVREEGHARMVRFADPDSADSVDDTVRSRIVRLHRVAYIDPQKFDKACDHPSK